MSEKTMTDHNKRLIIIIATTATLLLIPWIAMQFTDDVNWTRSDFVVAAILLLGTGLLCNLAINKVNRTKHRIAICIILLALLIVIWAELAVGIIGSPFSGS